MDTPVTFDWKIRLPDVLGVLRRDYAGRFPQLASAALETLLERLRDDLPEDFLPALGQELESLGLALVERLDEDDSLNLYVVGATHSRRLFDALAAQGHNARTLRQEDVPEGARAALPAAAPAGLAPASAYICLEHAEHLAPGLAIARLPGEDSRNLLDLRQWPRLQRLPDGAEETQGALLCRASSADGLHAWVRMTRSGSPYAWLHRSRDLASLTPELPPLPLPPAQSLRQRRTPELAIGLAGDDLLLADRGLFFSIRASPRATMNRGCSSRCRKRGAPSRIRRRSSPLRTSASACSPAGSSSNGARHASSPCRSPSAGSARRSGATDLGGARDHRLAGA